MILTAEMIQQYLTGKDKGVKAVVGVDLTVQKIRKIKGGILHVSKTELNDYEDLPTETGPNGGQYYHLLPGAYSVTFDQGIKMPLNATAVIRHRSSIARMGATITSGIYDPNFEVENMGAVLFTTTDIAIEIGSRIAQIVVSENYPVSTGYDGQWQKNKDVK